MLHHIRHVFAAIRYSLEGIAAGARSETAFQQEILALVILGLVAFLLFPAPEALLLIAGWLALMAIELLNMAIEAVADLVSSEFHPLIKRAKDGASGAVFIGICANACLWIRVFWLYGLSGLSG